MLAGVGGPRGRPPGLTFANAHNRQVFEFWHHEAADALLVGEGELLPLRLANNALRLAAAHGARDVAQWIDALDAGNGAWPPWCPEA